MPRFSGQQYPGALKDYRAMKRAEAEARQGKLPQDTTSEPGSDDPAKLLEAVES